MASSGNKQVQLRTTTPQGRNNVGGEEYQEERHRILTMKYGKQQMMLIRKRLKVEMWLMETLETLCEEQSPPSPSDCDLDIDTLLDIDGGDLARRKYCQDVLKTCSASKLQIESFIDELLRRLREL